MKFTIPALFATITLQAAVTHAYEHLAKEKLRRRALKGFYEAAPGTPLNTRMKETPEQRARRMQSFAEEGRVAPPDPAAEEPSVNEIYNPMLDAKCFNDQYHPPSVDKWELYEDYVKIFRWGFDNPPESPLHDFSTEVTNNRFPGFCLRMAFHDNAIDKGLDADEYIESNIDSNTGAWIGPDMLLESSGGDASVLTCKHERLHPNQNYDQTASRVLHAFQSSSSLPHGPGIDGGSLMSKYGFSYADALHNCALAAVKFMTEADASGPELHIAISESQKTDLANVIDNFSFGRKDACYITDNYELDIYDSLGAKSRRPLCGPTQILPAVTFSSEDVNDWFTSRGMPAGIWLSLFGTHTALDNFADEEIIRNYGLEDKDYFEDFVGCPMHQLREAVVDPEDGGCDWIPKCKDNTNTEKQKWHLVQSDCATSIDIIKHIPALDDLTKQMRFYKNNPGSWLPDVVCALKHLGGDNESCVGPNSKIQPSDGVHTLFGSFLKNDYPMPAKQPYPGHNSCIHGTWNDYTKKCECIGEGNYGVPGYCLNSHGKCDVVKEVDTAVNLYYCPGTYKPSEMPCEHSYCPLSSHIPGFTCMNGVCGRENFCAHGTWNDHYGECDCNPGYCKADNMGACDCVLVATHMEMVNGAWEWQYACNPLD